MAVSEKIHDLCQLTSVEGFSMEFDSMQLHLGLQALQ